MYNSLLGKSSFGFLDTCCTSHEVIYIFRKRCCFVSSFVIFRHTNFGPRVGDI